MSEIYPNNNIKTQFFLVYVKNLVNKFLAPLPEIRHYPMVAALKILLVCFGLNKFLAPLLGIDKRI